MTNRIKQATGLGAAGAAIVAGVALVLNQEAPPNASPDGTAETTAERSAARDAIAAGEAAQGSETDAVCLRRDLGLDLGDGAQCISRLDLPALLDRKLIDSTGEAAEMTYASPTDAAAALVVSSCRDYLDLRARGYFAPTTRDMRREGFFQRACGALRMLASSSPAAASNFVGDSLSRVDVADMAARGQFRLGPDDRETLVDAVDVVADGDGVWRYATNVESVVIQEIAFADFNADSLGDVLVFVAIGARGGTASANVLGYVEKTSPEGPPSFQLVPE